MDNTGTASALLKEGAALPADHHSRTVLGGAWNRWMRQALCSVTGTRLVATELELGLIL